MTFHVCGLGINKELKKSIGVCGCNGSGWVFRSVVHVAHENVMVEWMNKGQVGWKQLGWESERERRERERENMQVKFNTF